MSSITVAELQSYSETLHDLNLFRRMYKKDQLGMLELKNGRIVKKPKSSEGEKTSFQTKLIECGILSKISYIQTIHAKLTNKNSVQIDKEHYLAIHTYNESLKVMGKWNSEVASTHFNYKLQINPAGELQIFFTLIPTPVLKTDDEIALGKYFDLLKKYPNLKREGSLNDYKEGTYQIFYDPTDIARVQTASYERLVNKGMAPQDARAASRVGVVFEDQFWLVIRDAVKAPGGFEHTYNRLVQKSYLGGVGGAAVLPIDNRTGEWKISLILTFRHATNQWELELPRGGSKPGEKGEDTARRELKEESGFNANPFFLGSITPDSGVMSSIVPIYSGVVEGEVATKQDKTEAIAGKYAFTLKEIEEGLKNGYMEISKNNQKMKVGLSDPFLISALTLARIHGVIK